MLIALHILWFMFAAIATWVNLFSDGKDLGARLFSLCGYGFLMVLNPWSWQ